MDNQDKSQQKVLFLTPGATSDGGNMFLLRFLRWFKKNSDIPFIVLCGHGGNMEHEFKEVGETYKLEIEYDPSNFLKFGFEKVVSRLGVRKRILQEILRRKNIGLIFSNTVINHTSLPMFERFNVKILTYCHEMESAIQLTGAEEFRETCRLTNHFVAVSEAVQRELMEIHRIPNDGISLVRGFVPLDKTEVDMETAKREVFEELGIPSDAFLVGASGTLCWRKAPEIFLLLAANIGKHHSGLPIYFVWVGGASADDYSLYSAEYDIRKMGLSEKVFFLEHTPNPSHYFAAFDVFAMVSREDPFPLVCLESAALGKPIVCFEEAGGISEFVGREQGFVVPYMDIEVFAGRIFDLYENPDLKKKMGENAKKKIRKDHDLETEAPRILKLVEDFL